MVYWETAYAIPDQPRFVLEWARQWQAAERGRGHRSGCSALHLRQESWADCRI
jgi:hypothetical protein